MSEFNDGFHDQPGIMRRRQVDDEASVDLQLGERQLPQLKQRGVASAEIVDGKADALDAEARERVHQIDELLRRALRQLQHELVGGNLHFAAQTLHHVGEIEPLKTDRGDVEGEAGLESLLAPDPPLMQGRLETPLGELVDKAVLFSQWDEAGRRDGAAVRVVPANKGLDAR